MAVLNQCDIASALNWNRAGVTFTKALLPTEEIFSVALDVKVQPD